MFQTQNECQELKAKNALFCNKQKAKQFLLMFARTIEN
jgi:hypothetical protein